MSKRSQIEQSLRERHGDLHRVIPPLVEKTGQEGAARALNVKQAWVSQWLKRNHYRRVVRWERISQEGSR